MHAKYPEEFSRLLRVENSVENTVENVNLPPSNREQKIEEIDYLKPSLSSFLSTH